MPKIRLVLIEDNRLLRDGLSALINTQEDLELVAALGSAENLVQRLTEWRPGIVLLDLGLRTENSLRVVELVKTTFPDVKVIMMDLIPTQADIVDFIEAGAAGFILKDATFDEFVRTVRAVAEGTWVLPPPLTGSLFSHIVEQTSRAGRGTVSQSIRLTKREREIVELVAEGLSNKEIATRLNIAIHTVKSHVHNILEKLALHTRLQLASHHLRDKRELQGRSQTVRDDSPARRD